MYLSQCPVSPVKTGLDMDFSGYFEDALGLSWDKSQELS